VFVIFKEAVPCAATPIPTFPPKVAPVSTAKIPALSLSLILRFAPLPYISHLPVPLDPYNLT
jgi:hypothetical protein